MFFDNSKEEIKEEDLIPRKDFENLQNLAKTQQEYLNNIYIFYKLNPNSFLQSIRSLSYEFMKFFDNVCKKHDLEYWIDYGTLLGATRHEDFVPWDDDLDVSMMRKDYMKLTEVFQSEIDSAGLLNVSCAYKIDKRDKKSKRWFQINYHHPDLSGKIIGIDVFPCDFIKGEVAGDFEEKYYESRAKYYKRRDKSDDMGKIIDQLYSELNLTLNQDENFVAGVESVHGNVNMFSFEILKTSDFFPLQNVKFGETVLPAPKDANSRLSSVYGKRYMRIPKKIRDHGRLTRYREIENIEDIFNTASEEIKKANEKMGV